jgi:hypothetical protein
VWYIGACCHCLSLLACLVVMCQQAAAHPPVVPPALFAHLGPTCSTGTRASSPSPKAKAAAAAREDSLQLRRCIDEDPTCWQQGCKRAGTPGDTTGSALARSGGSHVRGCVTRTSPESQIPHACSEPCMPAVSHACLQ